MAKKVVATMKKTDAKRFVKVIKMVKNKKGNYEFKEQIINPESDVDETLSKM
jgi:hypothetical protein